MLTKERVMQVRSEMAKEGHHVSISQLCRWLGLPRCSFYYKPVNREKKLDLNKATKVKEKIEQFPTCSYRRLTLLLGMNKKVVQRICQLKGWQVRKRSKGHRPRAKAMESKTTLPNSRWAIDMTRVWCGKDRWSTLACVIDTCSRQIVGFRLLKSGKAATAETALQEGLMYRFGRLKRLETQSYSEAMTVWSLAVNHLPRLRDYNFTQEFIAPYTPERPSKATTPQGVARGQNGMIERFFRTIKEECILHHNFTSLKEANQIISEWIDFYSQKRKHSALRYKTPAEAFGLVA